MASKTIKNILRKYAAKFLFVLTFLCVFARWTNLKIDVRKGNVQFFEPPFFTADLSSILSAYFLVNSDGCRIPAMNPFDSSIREYIITGDDGEELNEGPIKCAPPGQEPYLSPLVSSNLSHIFIVDRSIIERNLSSPLQCCYEPFWGKTFQVSVEDAVDFVGADDQFETAGTCINFETSAYMGDNEFVKVECHLTENNSDVVYKDFFAFTPPVKRKNQNGIFSTDVRGKGGDGFNVLIVGLDSVSRLNLHRQMPKTVNYLKNPLKGVEMLGYNKIDDNTFPNVVPVLTGFSEKELKGICWPTSDYYFDNCPLLWKQFSQAGYTTMFAEDASRIGIFSYLKKGFISQPTDYYWRPFNKRAEEEIGSEYRMNTHICTGYRKSLQTLLNYGTTFALTRMTNESYFGLMWGSSLSHDYLNLPRFGDDDHVSFLRTLEENGRLNNTILVLMSDHGIRWGGIRSTYQGHMEDRLPFLFFVFPEIFKKKYPTALGYLHMNVRRLTTPFDLYETLLDVLHSNQRLTKTMIKERITNDSVMSFDNITNNSTDRREKRKGISLFLPVPANRTCDDAGIPDHWCTCHQTNEILINDTDVVKAAEHLIDHLNNLLSNEKDRCANLTLKKVISARLEQSLPQIQQKKTDENDGTVWLKDYTITVEAIPGNGNFEATVRRYLNGRFKAMGTVSRTNVYGSQSVCINNYRLKLYCYCIGGNDK